jgi:predicted phosphohydrolase
MGDLHLSLAAEKPMGIFGKRWEEHDKKIKKNWEDKIDASDTVVIPGDISWAMTLEDAKADFDYIEALPGKKIILKGNHDYYWQTKKKLDAFINKNDYRSITFLHNSAAETDDFIICGSRGWYSEEKEIILRGADNKKIIAREVARLKMSLEEAEKLHNAALSCGKNKEIVAFLHFPAIFKDYVCGEIIKTLCDYGIKRCYYGHIHGNYEAPAKITYSGTEFYLVSSDYLQFEPMLIAPLTR